jgi:hypothetical protein
MGCPSIMAASSKMTNLEMQRLLEVKYLWLPWRFMSKPRFIILSLVGIILMLICNAVQTQLHNRTPLVENSLYPVLHDGYVSLVIDRSKKNFCDTKPSRIAFQAFNYMGQNIPFIIALDNTSNVWPYLGHAKIALGLIREKDIPPGNWSLVVSHSANCNWLDWFAGGRTIVSEPVNITVPKLPPTEGQVNQ